MVVPRLRNVLVTQKPHIQFFPSILQKAQGVFNFDLLRHSNSCSSVTLYEISSTKVEIKKFSTVVLKSYQFRSYLAFLIPQKCQRGFQFRPISIFNFVFPAKRNYWFDFHPGLNSHFVDGDWLVGFRYNDFVRCFRIFLIRKRQKFKKIIDNFLQSNWYFSKPTGLISAAKVAIEIFVFFFFEEHCVEKLLNLLLFFNRDN